MPDLDSGKPALPSTGGPFHVGRRRSAAASKSIEGEAAADLRDDQVGSDEGLGESRIPSARRSRLRIAQRTNDQSRKLGRTSNHEDRFQKVRQMMNSGLRTD